MFNYKRCSKILILLFIFANCSFSLAYTDSDFDYLLTPDTSWKNNTIQMPTINNTTYSSNNDYNSINRWAEQQRYYNQQQEQQRQLNDLRRKQQDYEYIQRQQDMNNRYRQLNRKMF